MLTMIILLTVIAGFYLFNFVQEYFHSQYDDDFNTLAVRTFSTLTVGLGNNYLASQSLSHAFALYCPTLSQWPNCRFYN